MQLLAKYLADNVADLDINEIERNFAVGITRLRRRREDGVRRSSDENTSPDMHYRRKGSSRGGLVGCAPYRLRAAGGPRQDRSRRRAGICLGQSSSAALDEQDRNERNSKTPECTGQTGARLGAAVEKIHRHMKPRRSTRILGFRVAMN
jgi:hypothetical protein